MDEEALCCAWSPVQCYEAVNVARVYVKMAACYTTRLPADEKFKLEGRVGESPLVE